MTYDFAVIGGGIAGTSVAAELTAEASVVLLEAEEVAGYHSTGRSAAFWHETLGGPLVQQLSIASLPDLQEGGFLTPRTSLNVAEPESESLLDALMERFENTGARLKRLDATGVRQWVPRASDRLVGGVLEEICADIDVAALHAHFLARFRRRGGELWTDFRVATIENGDGWRISDGKRTVAARTIVNAAGAWADVIATKAGVAPLGIQPLRRTIAQVRVTTEDVPPTMPLTIDIAGTFYFKPEGSNRLWLCPHDETPVEPHDVAPEDYDVAVAIDRFETVTEWRVAAVERKWAGLRSFSPDRLPVFGPDPKVANFFWCAGQGGIGIQTSPAAGRLCAALLLGRPADAEIDVQAFSPARFT